MLFARRACKNKNFDSHTLVKIKKDLLFYWEKNTPWIWYKEKFPTQKFFFGWIEYYQYKEHKIFL